MTATKDALQTLRERIEFLRPQFPKATALDRIVAQFAEMPPAAVTPADELRRHVHRRVIAASRTSEGFSLVSRRDLKIAPWLLFDADEPLIDLPGFITFLLGEAKRRASLCLTLIESWLRFFKPKDAQFAFVGREISLILSGDGGRGRLAPWAEADRRYDLFKPDGGFATLVQDLLYGADSVEAILKRAGFAEPLRAKSDYMAAVQTALLQETSSALSGADGGRVMSRVEAVIAPDGELRFLSDTMLGRVARALTGPWQEGRLKSPSPLQARVLDFLLARLRDPRVYPQSWRAAGDETVALVKQWLARANLGAFFELVRRHVSNPDHFQYRRPFWAAYLDAGHIQDAWIALGDNIAAEARTIPDLKGTYGRLEGGDDNKALILMRIKGKPGKRDLIAAEWSDNGKLRIWLANDRHAPRLGSNSYAPAEVRRPCLPFPIPQDSQADDKAVTGIVHSGSSNGRWQWLAARRIFLDAGVQVQQQSYMPRW